MGYSDYFNYNDGGDLHAIKLRGIGMSGYFDWKSVPKTVTWMDLRRNKLNGHLNVSSIPLTIKFLRLRQNKFNSISDLRQLRGSSLYWLDVARNVDLNLDLSALRDKQNPIPLQ